MSTCSTAILKKQNLKQLFCQKLLSTVGLHVFFSLQETRRQTLLQIKTHYEGTTLSHCSGKDFQFSQVEAMRSTFLSHFLSQVENSIFQINMMFTVDILVVTHLSLLFFFFNMNGIEFYKMFLYICHSDITASLLFINV